MFLFSVVSSLCKLEMFMCKNNPDLVGGGGVSTMIDLIDFC